MISTEKETAVKQAATELLSQQPDWITFYREILGLQGIVRHTFPTREMLADSNRPKPTRKSWRCWPRYAARGRRPWTMPSRLGSSP